MSFRLDGVVPWGRNAEEYRLMFCPGDRELSGRIADFGGGPSSFNAEFNSHFSRAGSTVVSFDPLYSFSAEKIRQRIEEVRPIVMEQTRQNRDKYIWKSIPDPDALERQRLSAMELFLSDFEKGKSEGRYIPHSLPERIPFEDNAFDLGLSSHFLLMYTSLGYDFHIRSVEEMLRVCREVRIFPIVDLSGESDPIIADVIEYFKKKYTVHIMDTEYEFQKGGKKLLIIDHAPADRV